MTYWLYPAAFLMFVLGLSPYSAHAAPESDGPRPGKYLIQSFGAVGNPPLYLGYVVLDKDGTYEVFQPGDKSSGKGKYLYDAKKKEVAWTTGPYEKDFGGEFTVERDGKTHKIRLRRTTVATNSTDSQK